MYKKMMSDLLVRDLLGKWIRIHNIGVSDLEGFHRIVDVFPDDSISYSLMVVIDLGNGEEEGVRLPYSSEFDLLSHAPVENLIEGSWGQRDDLLHLFVDGDEILSAESMKVHNHGSGFNVGYPGSGCAQAALAILLAVTGDPEISHRAHQNFKESFLVRLPQGRDFTFRVNVHRWLEGAGYV